MLLTSGAIRETNINVLEHRFLKSVIYVFLLLLLLLLLQGCSLQLRHFTQQELEQRSVNFFEAYQSELEASARKSLNRIAYEYKHSDDQVYDVLILSGGGEYGAFGAGFLQGWGQVKEQGFTRPVFDSVSGVSTGALIAPFAFVGTEEAYQEIVDLYSNPDDNLITPRAVLSFLAGNDAYYDTKGLYERINASISPSLVDGISQGARDNRILLVGATNLDYGLMRVWDLAAHAQQHNFNEAHKNISQKLIASSAIPSAFPSVEIDDFLYVDGGASMQVVSGIDDREWLYDSNPQNLEFIEQNKPIKLRIWIVINNKLLMEPEVTEPTWSRIAQRSLATLMRGSTLQTLQDVETFSQMINKLDYFDVEMKYVAIPQSFEIPETARMFNKGKMLKLVELGREMGKNPENWLTRTLRPGAPFLKSNNIAN